MYQNLKAEIVKNGFNLGEFAKEINITNSTLSRKLKGKSDWTLDEAIKIKKLLNGNANLEELFKK